MSSLPPGHDDLFDDDGQGSASGPNPLLIVHRAMRGRYLLAGVLGLVLAVPLAVVGFIAIPPKYTSSAVLEANPTAQNVINEDARTENPAAFSAFVTQQASQMMSERILTNAIESKEMKEQNWPSVPTGLIRLRENLSVDTPRGANQIILSVSDESPQVAKTAAKAVLEAYRKIQEENVQRTYGNREGLLTELIVRYRQDRDAKRKSAFDKSLEAAGTEDLALKQRVLIGDLSKIENQIRELETLQEISDGAGPVGRDGLIEDSQLLRLIEDRDLLKRQLDSLLLSVKKEHRQAKQLERQITVLNNEIDARRALLNDSVAQVESDAAAETEGAMASEPTTDTGDKRPADLERDTEVESDPASENGGAMASEPKTGMQARLADLKSVRDEWKKKIEDIARARLEVFALQQEAEIANSRLEEAQARKESIEIEKKSRTVGKISVAQEPDTPIKPSTDRRWPLAGAGFVGGFGMGVAGVAAFGFLFPRVRVADDVALPEGDYSMLGMIPEFPESGESGASLSVREAFQFLRVVLDARAGRRSLVCGITSPTAGDGKTTIAVRLAGSFAAAGRRVLLIDADLVGRGTSRELKAEPIPRAMGTQMTLENAVVRIPGLGFDVIPASRDEDASEIFCGRLIGDLLSEIRNRYDVVLVDTGPILGSIEAAAITSVMDQMILVISRGMESRLLKMAADRLREMNAKRVGIVFNRATSIDFNRSFAPPSSTSRRSVRPGITSIDMVEARQTMDHHEHGADTR